MDSPPSAVRQHHDLAAVPARLRVIEDEIAAILVVEIDRFEDAGGADFHGLRGGRSELPASDRRIDVELVLAGPEDQVGPAVPGDVGGQADRLQVGVAGEWNA